MIGVYKITNLITGDFYVGASRNLRRREQQHFQKFASQWHSPAFDADIKKYGRENFEFSVIEECDASVLKERERHYLMTLCPTYNTVWFGRKRGKEFCEKVSKATKEWWKTLPQDTKEKIYCNLTGPPVGHEVSEETRAKISAKLRGRKPSPDVLERQRKGIVEWHKTHARTNANHRKRVIADGIEFESVKACAEYFSVSPSHLSQILKKGRKIKGHEVRFVV